MNPKLSLKNYVCFFSLLLIFFSATSASSKIYIDISSPFIEKIPIAISAPVLSNDSFENVQAAKKLTSTLKNDLEFHGFFSVFDNGIQGTEKVDYSVETSMDRQGNSLTVKLKLLDLSTGSMLVGRKYIGGQGDLRKMAHRFSNEIVLAITGKPGVSLSRIVF
ncbi:MAG: hypothetical protein DSZ23_03760, partial [Thermodesulfatator sp.]